MPLLITPASCCGCAEACLSCSGTKGGLGWGGCCNDAGEPDFSGIAGPGCPPNNPVPWGFNSCNHNCPRETIRYACCRIDGPSMSRTDLTLTHDGTPYSFPDSCIGVDGDYYAHGASQCTSVNYATCIMIAGTKRLGDVVSFASLSIASLNHYFPRLANWRACNLLRLELPNGGDVFRVSTRLLIVDGGSILTSQLQSGNCIRDGQAVADVIACELDPDVGTTILDASSSMEVRSDEIQFEVDLNLINDSASLAGKVSVPTPWLFLPGITIGQTKNKEKCTGI